MPYFDPNEENEVQECTAENPDSVIEQLAVAIQRLADTRVDRTLYGNFWLNEIKSLDDTIRIITNINILLIAGYSTIVVTNIKTISDNLTQISILPTSYAANFIIISIPIILWICSFVVAGENHNLPPQNAEPLLDNERASDYLIGIYHRRKDIEDTALTLLFLGPIYLVIASMLSAVLAVIGVSGWISFLLFPFAFIMLLFGIQKFLNFYNRRKLPTGQIR